GHVLPDADLRPDAPRARLRHRDARREPGAERLGYPLARGDAPRRLGRDAPRQAGGGFRGSVRRAAGRTIPAFPQEPPMRRAFALSTAVALALVPANRPAGAAPEKRLLLGIWSNYMPADVLAEFEKEQGCRVEVPWNYGSNDELLAKLQTKATGLDVVVPSDVVLPVLVSQGLLERVDPAKVPNLKHVDPAFLGRAS